MQHVPIAATLLQYDQLVPYCMQHTQAIQCRPAQDAGCQGVEEMMKCPFSNIRSSQNELVGIGCGLRSANSCERTTAYNDTTYFYYLSLGIGRTHCSLDFSPIGSSLRPNLSPTYRHSISQPHAPTHRDGP